MFRNGFAVLLPPGMVSDVVGLAVAGVTAIGADALMRCGLVALWLLVLLALRRSARRHRVRHFRHIDRHVFVHAVAFRPRRFALVRIWLPPSALSVVAASMTTLILRPELMRWSAGWVRSAL